MNILKNGARLSVNVIVAAFVSFFLCISINVIFTGLFTDYIGYNAYVYTEDSDDPVAEYQYLYNDTDGDGVDDGTDLKKAEYEEQGYTVSIYKVRSQLDGSAETGCRIITQILSFIMLLSFTSNSLYKRGFKDANLYRTGNLKEDYLKGFKTGLVANMPFFALFVLTVVLALGTAPQFRTVWYALLNSHFYSAVLWIAGSADTISKLGIMQFVLLFALQLVVPLISGMSYILGFKEISFTDKLVYKKR